MITSQESWSAFQRFSLSGILTRYYLFFVRFLCRLADQLTGY